MRASQARKSVEVAKDIQADKTLKSKAEKERILKEKQSMNTKMFIEERKKAAFKQAKRREKLKKNHDNQMNDLLKYMQTVRKTVSVRKKVQCFFHNLVIM